MLDHRLYHKAMYPKAIKAIFERKFKSLQRCVSKLIWFPKCHYIHTVVASPYAKMYSIIGICDIISIFVLVYLRNITKLWTLEPFILFTVRAFNHRRHT